MSSVKFGGRYSDVHPKLVCCGFLSPCGPPGLHTRGTILCTTPNLLGQAGRTEQMLDPQTLK